MNRRSFFLTISSAAFGVLSGCGYHTGGTADLIPKGIETISIPPFQNNSMRYRLTDQLPRDIAREFRARTRFQIENDPSVADAVLNGTVTSVNIFPTIFDPVSGKATSLQVSVRLTLTLLERTTGKVLYSNPNFEAREGFNISTTDITNNGSTNDQISAHGYFDESGPAYDRIGRDVARQIVSSVIENF